MENTTDDIYRKSKGLGLVAIAAVYLIYLAMYTEDSGYRFINEYYYFNQLWFITGAISMGLLFVSIADHFTTEPEARSWRIYRSFLVSLLLVPGFFVFTIGIGIVDFLANY